MKTELSDLWTRTLEAMEKEIKRPNFEAWLKNTRPIALYDGMMVVGVPNQFARDWVEDRFAPFLKRTLSNLVEREMEIRFVTPEDQNGRVVGYGPPSEVSEFARNEELGRRNPQQVQQLNPRYVFDTFVVGSSNRLAHAAALAVAEAPARAYNPLFIYGGVGLGKTHLMQAICHHVLKKDPSTQAVYVSCENFTNEMINAIKDRTTLEFRNRYRKVDLLLVDDIQFLAGKDSTQEEFFHTFNALHEANRQIVISSDRPPKEIPTLEDRLRSRFEWGLISDIQTPDLETRIAILRKKAQTEGLNLPDDVTRYIAERIDLNIRELEGALVRLVAYSSLTQRPIDVNFAAEALKDLLPNKKPHQITIPRIQEVVAEFYGLKVRDFKIRKRTRAVAFPRQLAMYLARELTDSSLPKIGDEFGGRDHTTVIHAHAKIAQQMAHDPDLEQIVAALTERVNKG